MIQPRLKLLDRIQKVIVDMNRAIVEKDLEGTSLALEKLTDYSDVLKDLLPEEIIRESFSDFERHIHFIGYYIGKKNFEWIQDNFNDIRVRDFPSIKEKIYTLIETEKSPKKKSAPLSKNVFIVHGRDGKPVTELKSMLKDIGLDPIVLHEKPSVGRTIVEKLEKYSDVGYAFVILTPDDGSFNLQTFESEITRIDALGLDRKRADNMFIDSFFEMISKVARQNVILEFGYFMGLLGRSRVCCLHKGKVELPSDMHGIVYLHFKNSVNEARNMILEELRAAGYEIGDQKKS